jgi:hypothetical protein
MEHSTAVRGLDCCAHWQGPQTACDRRYPLARPKTRPSAHRTSRRILRSSRNSVGLSTTPIHTANVSGRAATASWAQIATQAKCAPAPPPPVPQGIPAIKAHFTVTAYKNRVIMVKFKDCGIAHSCATSLLPFESGLSMDVPPNSPSWPI